MLIVLGVLFTSVVLVAALLAALAAERGEELGHALKAGDPMPFGKYRGTRMDKVPASYLHWLWVNERDPLRDKVDKDPVAAYIQNSLAILSGEYQGTWRS